MGSAVKKATPPTPAQTITFPVTLSLIDAQNLLAALTNAINQAAKKGAKKGSKGGKGGGGGGKGGK